MRDSKLCYLTSITVCVLSLLTIVDTANACSCIPVTVSELKQKADIIFQGTIIDIHNAKRDVITDLIQPPKRIAVFRVTRIWKGDVGQTFEMPAIEKSAGRCGGFPEGSLVVGNELLVYAYRGNGTDEYFTNICSRTSLLMQTKDLQELGRGRVPRKKVN